MSVISEKKLYRYPEMLNAILAGSWVVKFSSYNHGKN